jgi:hypothetical protein
MTLELTTEEVEVLYRALRNYRVNLCDDMCGDDRDDWIYSEVKRVEVVLGKVKGAI